MTTWLAILAWVALGGTLGAAAAYVILTGKPQVTGKHNREGDRQMTEPRQELAEEEREARQEAATAPPAEAPAPVATEDEAGPDTAEMAATEDEAPEAPEGNQSAVAGRVREAEEDERDTEA